MSFSLRPIVWPFGAVVLLACGPDSSVSRITEVPPVPPAPSPPPTPKVDSVSFAPPRTVMLGSIFTLQSVLVRSDGSRVAPQRPQWSSVHQSVLTVNSYTGVAAAVGVGTATVTVRAEDFTATATIRVEAPSPVDRSLALVITDFSVVEYEYAQLPGHKFYAPQLLVTAPDKSVTVLVLNFHVPGLEDPIPGISCGGRVLAGATRQLNGEVYGDWTFSVFGDGGDRATGEPATAIVSFVDESGARGTAIVRGPIKLGGLPDTYEGGKNGGPCFHGYGGEG